MASNSDLPEQLQRDAATSSSAGDKSSKVENTRSRLAHLDATTTTKSQAPPPKTSKWKSVFAGLNLDRVTLLLMMKGALPPTIVLAMYESDAIASLLGTLGYLAAIISIFAMASAPRARFLQNLLIGIGAILLAIAGGTLTVYSVVKARENTTSPISTSAVSLTPGVTPSQQAVPYNASASTVAGVWLFFWIYSINMVKQHFPQATIPVIFMTIITIVSCMNSPLFPTVAYAKTFILSLIKATFLGLAIATGVSLFILPISTRKAAKADISNLLSSLKKCIGNYRTLLTSFEDYDAMADMLVADRAARPEAKAAKGALKNASMINAKLQLSLPFAKREIGYGKIGPHELKQLNNLLRQVFLPTMGLESITSLFQHIAAIRGWTEASITKMKEEELLERDKSIRDWNENMTLVHGAFDDIMTVMEDAIDHISLQLQFIKPPKKSKSKEDEDVEKKADGSAPGDPGFAAYLDRKSTKFYSEKHFTLLQWGRNHGIKWPDNFFDNPDTAPLELSQSMNQENGQRRVQNQRQLYLLLYLEFLLWRMSRSLLDLVLFADELVANGHMSRNHFIVPNYRRLRKQITSVFSRKDLSSPTSMEDVDATDTQVHLGSSYGSKRDPEHLPAVTTWERLGDHLRRIPKLFRSSASAFGFRVAIASVSLAIPMFLRQTQRWSNEYRLFWAVIMCAISQSPTSGQSLFGFILRAVGTTIAMLCSWLIYYVAGNGKTAGILVLYWVFVALVLYIPLKKPPFTAVGLITIVTTTLIIGYELEARKIGRQAIEQSGQRYLPILTFGPARLATVLAGLAVAFIFTIFPYPISEHSVIRRDLGGSLYVLANYYSVVHETITCRVRGDIGNPNDKKSPAYHLQKERVNTYTKQMLLLDSLKRYSDFTKWEIPIGGKFPKQDYDDIILAVENITHYMALISYASTSFSYIDSPGSTSHWTNSFKNILASIRPTSHETVMLLSLLAASIRDGRPLPPYLPRPQAYELTRRMEAIDADILSVRHVNEAGYAAFAVLQLASRCIGADVEILVARMQKLLGEVDFSFHITRSEHGSEADVNEQNKED